MDSTLYLPPHVTQRTDEPGWNHRCWAAVGAWEALAASGGTVKVTPEEFARKVGGGSGRKPGSGTERDIAAGLGSLGLDAQIITVRFGDISDRVATERRAVFAVATDYSEWPVALDCMGGTAGPDVNHMVGLVPGVKEGKVRVMNPLCKEYQWVPVRDVERAAAAYNRAQGRPGIRLVRVVRPVPAVLDDLRKRIVELTEERDALRDYVAEVRRLGQDLLEVEVPKR